MTNAPHQAALSRDTLERLTCWTMTTGEAGMRSQVIGLADRTGIPHQEKIVRLKAPWKWLPGHRVPFAMTGLGEDSDKLTPPWPDLLITCGRRSVALSIAIKRLSRGETMTVHIQDPRVPPRYFDLVTPPRHDSLSGKNVISTLGVLHKVNDEKLAVARQNFQDKFANLPRPLVAVLIGGNSKSYTLTPGIAAEIVNSLKALADKGYGLIVTCSSRTGVENAALIRAELQADSIYVWDGKEENPYLGMLTVADYILVTSDSASMITEASATGKPVMILPLAGGSRKFDRLHAMMRDAGIIRIFDGELQDWNYPALDETGRIASIIRDQIGAHINHR